MLKETMKVELNKNAAASRITLTGTVIYMVLILSLPTAVAVTCFKESWPVKYARIRLCASGETDCWKYVMNDEGWGWWCQDVSDGAKACDTASTTITYDEYWGSCEEGNCHTQELLYEDESLDGTFGCDSSCYGG